MNILVTGASGFIGCQVVLCLLARGHRVAALTRNPSRAAASMWYGQVTSIAADISDAPMVEQLQSPNFDAVMHLAWPYLPNYKTISHLDEAFPAHLTFLKHLILSGIKQILVTGTCFEYGLQNGCLREDIDTHPNTPYAIAKDSLRRSLQMLQNVHPYRLQWARLFYMHGPGQNPNSLIPQIDSAIDRGETVFNMSGGEQLRDYLPVETVASHLVSLVEHPSFDGIINICSGVPVSVRRLVEERVAARNASIRLNLGHYPYPDHEPMAFWGNATKLRQLQANARQT